MLSKLANLNQTNAAKWSELWRRLFIQKIVQSYLEFSFLTRMRFLVR